jgi:hypothetical protein
MRQGFEAERTQIKLLFILTNTAVLCQNAMYLNELGYMSAFQVQLHRPIELQFIHKTHFHRLPIITIAINPEFVAR